LSSLTTGAVASAPVMNHPLCRGKCTLHETINQFITHVARERRKWVIRVYTVFSFANSKTINEKTAYTRTVDSDNVICVVHHLKSVVIAVKHDHHDL